MGIASAKIRNVHTAKTKFLRILTEAAEVDGALRVAWNQREAGE